jgi:hypothetical protein
LPKPASAHCLTLCCLQHQPLLGPFSRLFRLHATAFFELFTGALYLQLTWNQRHTRLALVDTIAAIGCFDGTVYMASSTSGSVLSSSDVPGSRCNLNQSFGTLADPELEALCLLLVIPGGRSCVMTVLTKEAASSEAESPRCNI